MNIVLLQRQLSDCTCYATCKGNARRSTPATTIISDTILSFIGEIGMRRAVQRTQSIIILTALVLIKYDKSNGGASRLPLKQATKKLYPVGFRTRGCHTTLSRSPEVELVLHEININNDTRRHAINHAPYSHTMALSKGG